MSHAAAIVDLDGTVYRGDELLPGVAAAIDTVRGAGMELVFISNNPTKAGPAYVERLQDLGLDVRAGEAVSAGDVTRRYLSEHHAEDTIMLIGAETLGEQLRDAGLELTRDPATTDVLVGSWTRDFDYDDMRIALRALDDDTVFLGTDPDRTVPTADGEIPGSGSIIGALEATVGRAADAVLGKPADATLSVLLDRVEAAPEDCLVVGDRLETDIALGERAGMTTVLVRTGVTGDVELAASDIAPDHVLNGIGDIESVLAEQ